ncbi:MAG: BON domain-containing protein [Burkholderiales bacterium]|nr:BON domain-containing protein [Burkholderiales bacterium]
MRALGLVLLMALQAPAAAEDRSNAFNDPFVAVTNGLPGCPVAAGPLLTHEEALAESHGRAQRGVSCWLAGRCRLSNSYLYDAEIIPRVGIAVQADGRFADTRVWALGQRRWVWLEGCVRSEEQRQALVALVRDIDDVEGVIDELMVGTTGKPPYETLRP